MANSWRDPELDALVRELNRDPLDPSPGVRDAGPSTAAAAAATADSLRDPELAHVAEGNLLDQALVTMVRQQASDLVMLPGMPWSLRIDGRLSLLTDGPVCDDDELGMLFSPHLDDRAKRQLEERGAADFTLRLGNGRLSEEGLDGVWRFRVNLHRQRGQRAAAIRSLPRGIPTLASLNLPLELADLVRGHRGLILVCGPTGAGKSTTLAALVGEINRTRQAHVITIEDPLEYEHRHDRALIEHLEIGQDSPSFAEALRASLRQDPDVILVGEMRDLETIRTALTAAETGHLILSTLHTSDVAQAIHRMIDVFPSDGQGQIRHQLALSLSAIVCQQLVPRIDGHGRVPAIEILKATYPVRQHIRGQGLQKLYNEMTLGQRQGMITLEASLAQLVRRGEVSREEAWVRANRPDELASLLS